MRANACERAQHLSGYHLAHDGRHERGGAQVRPLAALRTLAHGHRHGLLARVQHAQAADAAFARLLAHDSAQRAVHRVEHVGEPESFGPQLVGRSHAADEAHAVRIGVLRDGQLCRDRVDGVHHVVHPVGVGVQEFGHVLGQHEPVERLHLRLGVDVGDHRARHVHLLTADGAAKRDGLAVDVAGLHHVVVHHDEPPHAAARQRLDAVRAHAAHAQHHDGGIREARQAVASHDQFQFRGGGVAGCRHARPFYRRPW